MLNARAVAMLSWTDTDCRIISIRGATVGRETIIVNGSIEK